MFRNIQEQIEDNTKNNSSEDIRAETVIFENAYYNQIGAAKKFLNNTPSADSSIGLRGMHIFVVEKLV